MAGIDKLSAMPFRPSTNIEDARKAVPDPAIQAWGSRPDFANVTDALKKKPAPKPTIMDVRATPLAVSAGYLNIR